MTRHYRRATRVARFLRFPRDKPNNPGFAVKRVLQLSARRGAAIAALSTVSLLAGAAPGRPRTEQRAPEAGRIEGTASIAKVLTAKHSRIRVYDEPGTPPPRPAPDSNPLADVVVYLQSAPGLRGAASPPTHPSPSLHQRDEMFAPHVLPILLGSTVEFPNDDPLFHDVFSLSSARSFDLQRYPQGTSRAVTFNKAGVVEVFCHIHADMSAYIIVLDNPFFVVPDPQGHFALDGVPPGDYRLVAWYERSHPVTMPIHVDAGRTSLRDVRIPIPAS
jgi:plastocyanin